MLLALKPGGVSESSERQEIVAYCVLEQALDAKDETSQLQWQQQLREHLQSRLPDFMCPQRFVVLADFPRLPNGKVDNAALPEPVSAPRADTKTADGWVHTGDAA